MEPRMASENRFEDGNEALECEVVSASSKLKDSQASYFYALESAYGVIFEVDLENKTVECIHGRETSDIGNLYDIHMTLNSAKSFWLSNYIIEEDRPMMHDYFELITTPGAIAAAARPLQAEFRVTWDDNVTYTFLGVAVDLDDHHILFCLRDITEVRYRVQRIPDITGVQMGSVIPSEGLYARTFGYFDVFLDGKPLVFSSAKEKELLALLIDRHGGILTSDEAVRILWENDLPDKKLKARYRKLAMNLKRTLESYGITDLLIARNGSRCIDVNKVLCDYYEFLAGNEEFARSFHNAYMTGYSWSEMTLGVLWDCVR